MEESKSKFRGLINPNIDSFIALKNINKVYPNGFQAVYDFNLDIKKQEFIVFVGPSGCGKSTTLRMIAGLEDITAGDLYIDQVYSNNLSPKDRDIAMVFQNYALYPHMSVYDNMGFGLKMRHMPKEEIEERVLKAADILDLTPLLDRKPRQLSGGQMQRVALGRAIVRDAKMFLMDEPLSNLDAKLRVKMRSEIIKLHQLLNTTTIYVTHDQVEAMTMATRIVVMSKGFVQQIGTPQEVFNVVEKMPEFEGGGANMLEYLRKNIKYPVEAIKNGAQGRVIVQFVVNKDGSIVDANVVKSVSPELDAEALRVVQSMPKWIPGEQRGEKVRVQFTLPVQFKLPKAEDK